MRDRDIHRLDAIETCAVQLLRVRVVSCGEHFIEQLQGTPNGGMMSSTLLQTTLAIREQALGQHIWNDATRRNSRVAAGRCADDARMKSRFICRRCAARTRTDTYSRLLVCNIDDSHHVSIGDTASDELLNFIVSIALDGARLTPCHYNASFFQN